MFLKSFFVCGAVCICATAGFAQDTKASIKISRVDVKLEAQFTPQIQATNIVDKRWRPKQWLEVDVDFKSAIARSLGGREGTFPSLEIKYFLAFAGVKSADGKQVVASGTINYKDIGADESHALAFISPAALKRILQKENGGKADVSVFGVEISAGGEVLAFKSSSAGKFWDAADKISFDECIVPKEKTPFAPFWGDFDLQVAK